MKASTPYISENATVDLFGWVGASSTWTGVNKYGITSSSATNNTNGYGNVASESLKSDWGALIGLGWRTLSMAEWTYLLTTRTVNGGKGAGKSYTLNQSVNGKKGMVIYPDNYTGAVYSGSNWASFEAAGCVFLPAAGWRNGTTIDNINDRGFYWSSTPATKTDAKRMFFAGGLDLSDTNSRAFGFSVRLVKEYSLSTDATGDFIIASEADWEKFCSDINNGSTYSGQTVKLTADQTEWRQRYDDNRRANKRVSVKSDVVGNHLYQTARDWTWARLIEDGKALLAIDPDQPTRILSTDKKAQKAGGLCLALNGVPVKPTDDVDVDKEYQLIPLDSL